MSKAAAALALPELRAEGGAIVCNSRGLAQCFGKEHIRVLEAIRQAFAHARDSAHEEYQEVSGAFREVRTEHPTVPGRFDVSYDLTRNGFALIAMGFQGAKAQRFKLALLREYDAKERALHGGGGVLAAVEQVLASTALSQNRTQTMLEAFTGEIRRDVGQLSTGLGRVASHLQLVHAQVDEHGIEIRRLAERIETKTNPRKAIFKPVRADHAIVLAECFGGRCEVCRENIIVDEQGNELPNSRGDHAAQVDDPTFTRTWLICDCCNRKFGTGALDRNRYANRFLDYQATAAEFFREHPYRSKGGAVPRKPAGRNEKTDPRQPALLLPFSP